MDCTKTIFLNDAIFSDTFIILNKDFQKSIFTKLVSNYNLTKMSKIAEVSKSSIRDWRIKRRTIRFTPFKKLCKEINISENDLFNNILFFRTHLNAGQVKIKKCITIDNELAELIGFIKGDGCVHKKYVELANNCLNTVFYYTNTLLNHFSLNKSQIEVTIMTPLEYNQFPKKEVDY
jgi:hypothetical protein